jgi:hypothetical protein
VFENQEFAVLVPANEIAFLPDLVRSFSPEDIRAMQRRGAEVLRDWFALNSTCEYVLASLGRVKVRLEPGSSLGCMYPMDSGVEGEGLWGGGLHGASHQKDWRA